MSERSNKRIAKNTVALYGRLILTLGVSLYTSRVVLNALGIADYGVYNVVGGVVAMLGFFISSISTSTQRFLNAGMVKESGSSLIEIFSTAVNVHILIGFATVVVLETVGLWFVTNELVIPEGQQNSALWVFQCSVAAFFVSIISAPYNAAIIAYEKMTVYAFMSVMEVLLKLGVALSIMHYGGNKLELYALLILGTSVVMRVIYGIYCSRVFLEIKYRLIWSGILIKRMMSFSGWMVFGCLSDLLSTQGVNMIINIFFGPVFNAARAIAVQVQSAVAQFSNSFIMSVNPQIVKSYVAKEYTEAYNLVFMASKLSFFLMLIVIIPIIIRSEEILVFWLKIVPDYAPLFVNLILLEYLIRSSYTPIAQVNQASGNIKMYQIAISILFSLVFVLTYIFYKIGYPVYTTFIISIAFAIIGLFVRLWVLNRQLQFPSKEYIKKVTSRLLIITIMSFLIGLIINIIIPEGLLGIMMLTLSTLMFNLALIWTIGLNKAERIAIKIKANSLLKRSNLL